MKILHVLSQLPAKTGSGVYYSNVIKAMSHATNACLYGKNKDERVNYLPVEDEHHFSVTFPNTLCAFNLPGMSDVMPYKSTIYREMDEKMIANWHTVFEEKLEEAVEHFKPDIIFSHHLWFLTSMVQRKYPTIPIVAFCHGTDLRQAKQNPLLASNYLNQFENIKHIFALSSDQIEDIVTTFSYPKSQISVLGGGYDNEIFYRNSLPKPKREEIKLVFAGKISQAKGAYELLEVFDEIVKDYPNVTLSLVSAANEEAEEIIRTHQAQNKNLLYFNVKTHSELGDVFRDSDIFILPSYYEGLGLTAIEALASGLRVVVTEITALMSQLGDQVNDSGLITYVPLPRLRNQDQPFLEDLPIFKEKLKGAIIDQIHIIKNNEWVDEAIYSIIEENAWSHILKKIDPQRFRLRTNIL